MQRKKRSRLAWAKRGTLNSGWYGMGRPHKASRPNTPAKAANSTVSSNYLYDNYGGGILQPIGSGNAITANSIFANLTGINIGNFCDNTSLTGNAVYNNTGANALDLNSANLSITSNQIYSNAGNGIGFAFGGQALANETLTGNTVYSNGGYGILQSVLGPPCFVV